MSSNVYLSPTQTSALQQSKTYVDPIAQSFIVDSPGGAFLTSIDLYFETKDSTLPVTLEIREMENGIPTGIIVPFSTVTVAAIDVVTSSNATLATKFTFSSPVFLLDTSEYCFVVNANSRNYKVWVAQTGGTDVTNTSFSITKQPYAGVMFKSQNASTWVPEQNLDIKFVIRRAEFATSGSFILNEAPLPVVNLPSNSLYTYNGTKKIRVFQKNHGHFTGSEVTIANLTPATSYNGILGSVINGTQTVVDAEQDSYTFVVGGSNNASADGLTGGSGITATENRAFDILYPNVQQLGFKNTRADWFVRTTSGHSLAGNEIPHSLSSYYQIPVNQNVEMKAPQVVRAVNTASPTSKSLYLKGNFSTTQTTLSPVVDLNRTSAIAINFRLDRPASTTTAGEYNGVENYQAETVAIGSSALSKYITRRVDLATAASELRIFLGTNRPTGSYISVYYKVTENIDANFDSLTWAPVSPLDSVPIDDNANSYTDVEYAVTSAMLSSKKFVAFAIKVVFTSTNSSAAPSCSDLRAIAVT